MEKFKKLKILLTRCDEKRSIIPLESIIPLDSNENESELLSIDSACLAKGFHIENCNDQGLPNDDDLDNNNNDIIMQEDLDYQYNYDSYTKNIIKRTIAYREIFDFDSNFNEKVCTEKISLNNNFNEDSDKNIDNKFDRNLNNNFDLLNITDLNNKAPEHIEEINDPDYSPDIDNDNSSDEEFNLDIDPSIESIDDLVNESSSSNKENANNTQSSGLSDTLNTSINARGVGEAIKNDKKVKSSKEGVKKYACIYCKKLVSKLAEHILNVHKDVEEIKKLNLMSKVKRRKGQPLTESQKNRLDFISNIRKAGNFQHNINATATQDFIPSRRPRANKEQKKISSFGICPKCKEAYSKQALHKHVTRCTKKSFKTNHAVQKMSSRVLGNFHDEADELFIKVASVIRDDLVGTAVKNDLAIVLYGKLECFKYRATVHLGKMIRAKLRRLGRLLLKMKELSNEITDFASILNPKHFDLFIQAVNDLGGYDEETQLFGQPATADAIGMLTKEVCATWIIECIKRKKEVEQKNAELFKFIYEKQFNKYIGSTVCESQSEMRRLKKINLPQQNDIVLLNNYLTKERRTSYEGLLKNGYNYSLWKTLSESTLISIQVFNRRRAGELERLKIQHFEAIEKIDEQTCPEIYQTLNKESKKFVDRYCRILLRGKRNRTVPILLTEELRLCVEMILKYRKATKISSKNPYVFAMPSVDSNNLKFLSACDLMRHFSNTCGASDPDSLRGTLLRKHVATACIALNLKDNEVEDLVNHMGHSEKIHKDHYRVPLAQRDIVNVAALLEKAQGVFLNNDRSQVIEETDSESEENQDSTNNKNVERNNDENNLEHNNEIDTSERDTFFSTRKRLRYSDENEQGTKKPWDESSRQAVLTAFKGVLTGEQLFPTGKEIGHLISTTPVATLRKRTVPQVRSWLHTQKKLEQKAPSKPQRNRLPNFIFSLFEENIKKKIMPSTKDIIKSYEKSPTSENYSVKEIKELLQKAMDL